MSPVLDHIEMLKQEIGRAFAAGARAMQEAAAVEAERSRASDISSTLNVLAIAKVERAVIATGIRTLTLPTSEPEEGR